jgi:hypothetical protein
MREYLVCKRCNRNPLIEINDTLIFIDTFHHVSVHGIPLVMLLPELYSRGIRVSWNHFIEEALREGWSWKHIKGTCLEAERDTGVQGVYFNRVYRI